MSQPTDPDQYKRVEIFEYDPDKGIVAAYDEFVRHEYTVRANMLDRVIRFAAIAELEKLGYTVIPPETDEESSDGS